MTNNNFLKNDSKVGEQKVVVVCWASRSCGGGGTPALCSCFMVALKAFTIPSEPLSLSPSLSLSLPLRYFLLQ